MMAIDLSSPSVVYKHSHSCGCKGRQLQTSIHPNKPPSKWRSWMQMTSTGCRFQHSPLGWRCLFCPNRSNPSKSSTTAYTCVCNAEGEGREKGFVCRLFLAPRGPADNVRVFVSAVVLFSSPFLHLTLTRPNPFQLVEW